MKEGFHLSEAQWTHFLENHSEKYNIYAPVRYDKIIDYELINKVGAGEIDYNIPRPITPLKLFFLPVKENVTLDIGDPSRKNIIIGVPSCDLIALDLLDEIYLNESFPDPYYLYRRENTILIGADCYGVLEHCHCTSYGENPYPTKNYDLVLSLLNDRVYLLGNNKKAEDFLDEIKSNTETSEVSDDDLENIFSKRKEIRKKLAEMNANLPDYKETSELIKEPDESIWEKYSKNCVSCGACAAICPTCTCFLLVDRPGFEKVRQLDACQYPGFSRVAAGGDHLKKLSERFKNRYLCKYVWKPEKFGSIACTGCGRCIETCIGEINKNELFVELASAVEA